MSTKHFTPADATDGVKGAKPRFKSAREELPQINRDYLEVRTQKLRAQAFLAEAQAREKAGELISRQLVIRQAQFILICLRASVLNFPMKYAYRMVRLPSEHEAKQVLTKAAHEFLTELSNFSEKITNPEWLRVVEADGQREADGQPLRPASGQGSKAEQRKAKIRRRKKTETMRNLRSKG